MLVNFHKHSIWDSAHALAHSLPTTYPGRSRPWTSSWGHCHSIRISNYFTLSKELDFKAAFQVLLGTEMKGHIFWCHWSFEKRTVLWLSDKHSRSETSGLLLAFPEHSALTCLWWFVLKWIFHFMHWPLRKEVAVPSWIYIVSYCDLA